MLLRVKTSKKRGLKGIEPIKRLLSLGLSAKSLVITSVPVMYHLGEKVAKRAVNEQ